MKKNKLYTIKEIFKYIVAFGSLVVISTFITLVAYNMETKIKGLIVLFCGLWIAVIIMINFLTLLWPKEETK